MSYILDALRKADAERERDPARGIHAQPTVTTADAPRRLVPWAAGAVALVAVGAGAAWLLRPAAAPGAPAVAVAAPATAVVVPVVAAAPAPVVAPAPVTQAPPAAVVVPVAAAVSPPAAPPLPPRAPERSVSKAAPAVVAKAAPAAPVAASAAAPVPAAAAAPASAPAAARAPVVAPAPVAAPAAERVLAVAELPPDVQRELPKVQISGGVHSQNAAQRMLIVGGQVMNEGAEIAPGVLLEQIRPHTAVLKFRGYRYSVGY